MVARLQLKVCYATFYGSVNKQKDRALGTRNNSLQELTSTLKPYVYICQHLIKTGLYFVMKFVVTKIKKTLIVKSYIVHL